MYEEMGVGIGDGWVWVLGMDGCGYWGWMGV